MYPTSFTTSGMKTIRPKTFRLASKYNYASLHIFILANPFFFCRQSLMIIAYWSLIVIHSIHRYVISKSFINVNFILVLYYMIHDIIY